MSDPPGVDRLRVDRMDVDGLLDAMARARLHGAGGAGLIGRRIEHHRTIDSTNDRARELAASGEPEGCVVVADEQTRGRGRSTRHWHSASDLGLYMTVILRPDASADRAPIFGLLTAVAAASALERVCGARVAIKWPNDLVVAEDGSGRRKLAGILAESRAGDRLRDLVPDAGHLIHMPTHIDVLCGHYRDVLVYNQKAIAVDRKFLAREGALNVYALYRTHDYHFAIYGAMFLGQYGAAMEAAQELIDTTPEGLLRIPSPPMADFVEGYLSMKQHVLVRFGKWQEIIAQELPRDPELYCSTTAMMLYAQAVAHSALGHIAQAEAAKAAFIEAKRRVPESRRVHNNTVRDLLAVAEEMLNGEIEYRRGNYEVAFAHLRRSVERDDALPYDEPWGWMQPTRHALGALLLEQGRVAEAEAIYRSDLGLDGKLSRACQHPDNLWSLHGLHECLTRRGETVEAALIKQRLDLALARSEVPVKASCFCRTKVAA